MTLTATRPAATQSQVALHMMINGLSVNNTPAAASNKDMIINHIPEELYVNADQEALAVVIENLLSKIICHNKNTTVRISAKKFHNVMLLHMKSDCQFNSPAFAGTLTEIEELAENIGGTVSVTSYRNNVTTVALSFINHKLAA